MYLRSAVGSPQNTVELYISIEKRRQMAMKLYIGSLSYSSTDDSLRNYFAKVGEVTSASVVMDKMTGRSRGFGFVEMANDEDAKRAISELDNTELDGRTIRVSEARPREEGAPRRSFGGGGDRGGNRGGGYGGGDRGGRGGY